MKAIQCMMTILFFLTSSFAFSQTRPPKKPIVTATAGDGWVQLAWDTTAENSFEPFIQEYDFEGYRIFRSLEPSFLDIKIITDGFGNRTFRKPIAIFDSTNGIKEWFPVHLDGLHYWLGTDAGLQHTYTDCTVVNGTTYFYAVVSFDRGYAAADFTLYPLECSSLISIRIDGTYGTDVNTVVITPGAPTSASRERDTSPIGFELSPNYPNPFHTDIKGSTTPGTTIQFSLPEPGIVKITIYNIKGQLVRQLHNGHLSARSYSIKWDGRNDVGGRLASGIYLYHIQAGALQATRKMMLTR